MSDKTYNYDVWFEVDGESLIINREYDHEVEWDEIWQDIVDSGDLQMSYHLVSIEGE